MFQSTHPRGVRRMACGTLVPCFSVSIHAPTRGATKPRCSRVKKRIKFQSTHPRGVRLDTIRAKINWVGKFQSTHPRGVRRSYFRGSFEFCQVSIHAPTRGATAENIQSYAALLVSIHAPTRGATFFQRKGHALV